jgi:hypothetical protein
MQNNLFNTCKVVNLKNEPYDVYIGRGSKWGNPFVIGRDGDRDEVCDRYAEWFYTQLHLIESLQELAGKNLGCYCKPERCHGDFLVKMAQQYLDGKIKYFWYNGVRCVHIENLEAE